MVLLNYELCFGLCEGLNLTVLALYFIDVHLFTYMNYIKHTLLFYGKEIKYMIFSCF